MPTVVSQARTVRLEPVKTPLLLRAIRRLARAAGAVRWRRRFALFGPGAVLERPELITGAESIAIGAGVRIWPHARLEAINAGRGRLRMEIGDGTVIQPYVHIGAVESVRIGRQCLFASRVYVTDHDHDICNPEQPAVARPNVVAAAVEIGDSVWLGEGVMVLKGVSIGERSIVGAGSVVTRSIPSWCIAVGAPARVIRRWDPSARVWAPADS